MECLAVPAGHDLDRIRRIQAMKPDLAVHRVFVRREVQVIQQDPKPFRRGVIERSQSLVDVDGSVGTDGHLTALRADERSHETGQPVLIQEVIGLRMRPDIDAVGFPVIQSLEQCFFRVFGTKTAGVPIHVDPILRDVEAFLEPTQRILFIHGPGKRQTVLKLTHHDSSLCPQGQTFSVIAWFLIPDTWFLVLGS
ncbi:hypothetical protein DSECCO2_358020 [anaerobic digester metagenome]